MDETNESDQGLEARRLAHDVVQSVTIIRAAMARHRLAGAGVDAAEVLQVVERELVAVADLCHQQLQGSGLPGVVNPWAIVADVVARVRATYLGDLDLEVVDAGEQPTIRGWAVEWERCVMNLLENACRAAGPQGRVQVRCSSTDHTLVVEVGDSGPGFGEAPAGRASLGMVAVMRLVDRHGGHLELRRSALGGAQLNVVLPIEQPR